MIDLHDYEQWRKAYEFFNSNLWSGSLNSVFISYDSKAKNSSVVTSYFEHRYQEQSIHKLSFSPIKFNEYTDKELLSLLVHEMCHIWQYQFGDPSRNGYHNREWVTEMLRVGLLPISETGGTGQSVYHEVIKGAEFDRQSDVILEKGFQIKWQGTLPTPKESNPANVKVKYECQCVEPTKVWGKPEIGNSLVCTRCNNLFEEN